MMENPAADSGAIRQRDARGSLISNPLLQRGTIVLETNDWKEYQDDHGNDYWFNHKTGESRWTLPSLDEENTSQDVVNQPLAKVTSERTAAILYVTQASVLSL